MSVDLQTALRRLYDAEIDHGLHSRWDAGWDAWVRGPDGLNTFRNFLDEELAELGPWLVATAAALFPGRVKP